VTTTFEARDTTCPRCGEPARLRFAGPCPDCMTELHARFPGVAREIETEGYVPKMNVTPNAVALKDD
jgi:tRNA(Ile2) C34 agmatinyltransferase TiaS